MSLSLSLSPAASLDRRSGVSPRVEREIQTFGVWKVLESFR